MSPPKDPRVLEVSAWPIAELVAEIARRHEPSKIPPCRVCGGPLSLEASGGGEPSRWACSIGKGESDTTGHYVQSQHVDQHQSGDPLVVELLARVEGLRSRETRALGIISDLVQVAPSHARGPVNAAVSFLAAYGGRQRDA